MFAHSVEPHTTRTRWKILHVQQFPGIGATVFFCTAWSPGLRSGHIRPDVALTDVFPQSGHGHPDVALTDVFPQSGHGHPDVALMFSLSLACTQSSLCPVWSPWFWPCHIPLSPWCWFFVVCSRWGRRSREWRGTGGGGRRRRNRQGTGGRAAERWKVSQLCRDLEHFCPRKKSVSLYSHSYGHPRHFYRNVPHIPIVVRFYCAGISTEMFPTSLLWCWFYCFAVQAFLQTNIPYNF